MVATGTPQSGATTPGSMGGGRFPGPPPPVSTAITMSQELVDMLGGGIRATARSDSDIKAVVVTVSKTNRDSLSEEKKAKFHAYVTAGLANPFAMVQIKEGTESFEHVYDLVLRTQKLRDELDKYDLSDVFEILPMMTDGTIDGTGSMVNLFESFRSVTLSRVRHSSMYYFRHGAADYLVENLVWSGDKVLNSCDEKLREAIEDSVLGFSAAEKCGPVYFKIMMEKIFSDSDKSMRAIVMRLQAMKMGDFAGENVVTAAGFIRGAVTLLRACNYVPLDIDHVGVERERLSTVSTVWEDNSGALQLMNMAMPRMTPRTKHIAVKYHWFRSHITSGEPGGIEVRKIGTADQKGDIFTKGLCEKEFCSKRNAIMGWHDPLETSDKPSLERECRE